MLRILVTIGLTVGFGVQCSWWVRMLAGLGAFAGASALVKWHHSSRWMMAFMHYLTGS